MSSEPTERLIAEIGTLKTQCEELRVRNEVLQYHLDRTERKCRDLQREADELLAAVGIRVPHFSAPQYDPPAPIGWGKGKDE